METNLDLRNGARGSRDTVVFSSKDGDVHFLGEYFDACTFDSVIAPDDLRRYRTDYAVYHWLHVLKTGGRLVLNSPTDKLMRYIERVIPFSDCYRLGNLFVVEKLPIEEKKRSYRHSGARGDLIYALPCIEAMGGGDLIISLASVAYKSAPMTCDDVSELSEVFERVPYLDSVKVFERGDRIDWNLNRFRRVCSDYAHLALCHLVTAGVGRKLSSPWIDKSLFDAKRVAPIVVSRSQRYHGYFDWDVLNRYQDSCVFLGTKAEHEEFTKQTGLNIDWYGKSTMLEMVEIIAGCSLFIGNQSFPYSIAEAMKVPRVLEVFMDALNSLPHGLGGYTRLTHELVDGIVGGNGFPVTSGRKFRMTFNENRCRSRSVAIMISASKKPLECCCMVSGEFSDDTVELGVKVIRDEDSITGDLICVIDCSEKISESTIVLIEQIFDTMKRVKRDGLFGQMDVEDGKPIYGGNVYGISRRVYEECGLRRKGESRADMVKRYGKAGYRFYSVGGA